MTVSDLDGDGNPDVVMNTGAIQLIRNNWDGTFAAPLSLPIALSSQINVVAVDLDGDGRPDLVTGDSNTNFVHVFLNRTPQPAGTGSVRLSRVLPDHGGNAGAVSVRVFGSGLEKGAQVRLRIAGQPGSPATTRWDAISMS